MGRRHIVFSLLILLAFSASLHAAAPALREQISLNGTWTQGGNVPHYASQDNAFDFRTYERQVTVPSTWSGKRVQLEFGAVNWYCDVFINGTKIGSHTGAWVPFEFDISSRVSAGQTFTLRVDVKGELQAPTYQNGKVLWWIGYNDLDKYRAGIVDDVWLRAYGQVNIIDTFVQTSFRNNQIKVEYTIRNQSSSSWTGHISGDIIRESSGSIEKTIQTADVTVPAGQSTKVTVTSPWTNPALWWPDQPNLYHLKSTLSGGGRTDVETRRFGFREFWCEGNQFRLNGIRVNIRGDWSCFSQYWGRIPDAATLKKHYDGMRATNANMLRWHKHPAPRFAYDMADEMGIMIINESPVYGRPYMNHDQKTQFITNCVTLIPAWIKAARNHASVMIWSACNEATYGGLSAIPATELKRLGDAIYLLDTTRPVNYDGDSSVPGVMVNRHYPEGYEKDPTVKWPNHDCYNDWKSLNDVNRPTYFGEILAVRPGENQNGWWIGVWPRGLRHANFAGIAPRVYYAGGRITDAQEQLQKNAYNPIALFDMAYDKLGIAPFKDNILPTIDEGSWQTRRLVLFNDDYRNTTVTAEVEVLISGVRYAIGSKSFTVDLGAHFEFDYKFQTPFQGGKIVDVVLRTFKGGVKKFEESKRFNIRDVGTSGTSSNVVTLDGSTPTNVPPSVIITAPANDSSFTAPASITITASASDSDGTVSKVEFFSNGALINTDTSSPYSFTWASVAAGTYSLTARATDNDGATKTSAAVSVTVKAPTVSQAVTSFALVNADTDTDIGPLANNATIDLSKTPTRNLNVRANTNPATVGSVKFGYDGNANYHVENGSPYALGSGTGTNYSAWTPAQGSHTLTATPYTSSNATGTAGTSLTINFSVIDPPAITSAPTSVSGSAGQSVKFTVAATDPNGDALTYSWNFGDGSTGTGSSVSHVYTSAGQFTAVVTVTDGKGGSTSASITVNVATSSLKINFQAPGATTPSGYLADTGATFGSRGNGQSYGWNIDNSSTARDRNSTASPDQRYDSLQHLQKPENPNAKWEIAVANGSYRVRTVCGDPSYYDSVYKLNVEGALAVSGTPTSTTRWIEGTVTVTVSDGRLTLTNASGAANNKLCFVEISTVSLASSRSLEEDETVPEFQPLKVLAASTSLNFATPHGDKLKLSVELPGTLETLEGAELGVDVAGIVTSFILDAKGKGKGKGKNELGSVMVKVDKKNARTRVTLTLSKGDWSGTLSDGGVDKSVKKSQLTLPVAMSLGGQTFGGGKTSDFTSTGKAGRLK